MRDELQLKYSTRSSNNVLPDRRCVAAGNCAGAASCGQQANNFGRAVHCGAAECAGKSASDKTNSKGRAK